MKKKIVLLILFLLPVSILIILFFSDNNYTNLSVINEDVAELVNYTSLENEKEVQFSDNITILGFLGNDVEGKKVNVLNLNQKIYKRFSGFKNFQFVMLALPGQEKAIEALKYEISRFADDLKYWNFVIVDEEELMRIYYELDSPLVLDGYKSSDYVYIIDKDKNLRGRIDDRSEDEIEEKKQPYMLYGYDTISIAELSGKMTDDLRILFKEYRDRSGKRREETLETEDVKK